MNGSVKCHLGLSLWWIYLWRLFLFVCFSLRGAEIKFKKIILVCNPVNMHECLFAYSGGYSVKRWTTPHASAGTTNQYIYTRVCRETKTKRNNRRRKCAPSCLSCCGWEMTIWVPIWTIMWTMRSYLIVQLTVSINYYFIMTIWNSTYCIFKILLFVCVENLQDSTTVRVCG